MREIVSQEDQLGQTIRERRAGRNREAFMAAIRADIALEEMLRETQTELVQHHIDRTINKVNVRQLRALINSCLYHRNECIAWAARDLRHDLELFVTRHFKRTGKLLGAE